MLELEKILNELEKQIFSAEVYNDDFDGTYIGNLICLGNVREVLEDYFNDGWISVEKFGLPTSNEHDFRFWITIQYANGFRRTIKAKYDFFDKCFAHQNGKKILQDVIAYKYYSAPEPYRPERRI